MSHHYSEDEENEKNVILTQAAPKSVSIPALSKYRGLVKSRGRHEDELVEINAEISEIELIKPDIADELAGVLQNEGV